MYDFSPPAVNDISNDPEDWSFSLLQENGIYKKIRLISNLQEQVLNFIKDYNCQPDDFIALQKEPELKNGIIIYAPDDGQAGQFETIRIDTTTYTLKGQIRLTETDNPQTLKD